MLYVFYRQIYPSLLPGREFPNLAGAYPPAGLLGALGSLTHYWQRSLFMLRLGREYCDSLSAHRCLRGGLLGFAR
jgi:hypothetical protein